MSVQPEGECCGPKTPENVNVVDSNVKEQWSQAIRGRSIYREAEPKRLVSCNNYGMDGVDAHVYRRSIQSFISRPIKLDRVHDGRSFSCVDQRCDYFNVVSTSFGGSLKNCGFQICNQNVGSFLSRQEPESVGSDSGLLAEYSSLVTAHLPLVGGR
jgi:hypothetical protein